MYELLTFRKLKRDTLTESFVEGEHLPCFFSSSHPQYESFPSLALA